MMDLNESILDVGTDEGTMAVLVKEPATGGPYPTVVIFHDAPAIREAIHDFMRKLAADRAWPRPICSTARVA